MIFGRDNVRHDGSAAQLLEKIACPCSKSENYFDGSWRPTGCGRVRPKRLDGHNDGADHLIPGSDNTSRRGRLYGTRPRVLLAERKMCSDVVIVLKIAR
jgi:hypothetical protein